MYVSRVLFNFHISTDQQNQKQSRARAPCFDMVENQEDIDIPVKTMTPFPSGSQENIIHPGPDFSVQAL